MKVKLFSDMFRSTLCTLTVINKGIKLVSDETETIYQFEMIRDISISQNGNSQVRFEITTDSGGIFGTFDIQSDVEKFIKLIKEKAGKNLQTELRFQ